MKHGRPAERRRVKKPPSRWAALMASRAAAGLFKNVDCSYYLACLNLNARNVSDGVIEKDHLCCRFCQFEGDRGRVHPFSDNPEQSELLGIARLLLAVFFDDGA